MATTKTVTKTKTRTDAGWTVTASWEIGEDGPLSVGPSSVAVTLAPDVDPQTKRRGYTTGVARKVERMIAEMQVEVVGQPKTVRLSGISERALREAIDRLPESPRKDPDAYYTGLLRIFDMLAAAGYPAPLNMLAERLGVPKNTVKTRLANARARLR
jgi:hypothetical protein